MKRNQCILISLLVVATSSGVLAQTAIDARTLAMLPSAPTPQAVNQNGSGIPSTATQSAAPQTGEPGAAATTLSSGSQNPSTPSGAQTLTLQEAEALAVKNNPQISVARLIALASQQVTRVQRSALWPQATGDITGVDAQSGSRITAGALNNPIIYERAAAGLTVSQLISDFGRTKNLISSADFAAKAENENALATKEQILLAVNKAFYAALQSQALLTVAEQTVKERQTVADQVGALFKSKLKSQLDFSFANVNLAQAQLLLLDAQNNVDATQADLSMILGFTAARNFRLIEDASPVAAPPTAVDDLIAQGHAIHEEQDGLKVLIDLQKLDKAEAVKALEGILTRLKP